MPFGLSKRAKNLRRLCQNRNEGVDDAVTSAKFPLRLSFVHMANFIFAARSCRRRAGSTTGS